MLYRLPMYAPQTGFTQYETSDARLTTTRGPVHEASNLDVDFPSLFDFSHTHWSTSYTSTCCCLSNLILRHKQLVDINRCFYFSPSPWLSKTCSRRLIVDYGTLDAILLFLVVGVGMQLLMVEVMVIKSCGGGLWKLCDGGQARARVLCCVGAGRACPLPWMTSRPYTVVDV
jgi:hypothetical protein